MFRNTLTYAVALFGLLFLPIAAAYAQGGPAVANSEIRVTIFNGEAGEHHVWQLLPNGAVTGVSAASYNRGPVHYYELINDRGTWRLEGSTLCLTWSRLQGGGTHCYRISISGKQLVGTPVSGGTVIRGTITARG